MGSGGNGHGYGYDHHHGHGHRLPLEMKEEGKLFSRNLSKESSGGNSSYRVLYYGGAAGAVPFMWEIQPGTPKHTLSDTSLTPPLTPPPSHHASNPSRSPMSTRRASKPWFLFAIFPRLAPATRKPLVPSLSSYSWSTGSRSSTRSAVKSRFQGGCCLLLGAGRKSGLHFDVDDEDDDDDRVYRSTTSTLKQFGVRTKIDCRRPWIKPRYYLEN